jgi:hypothetical protein
MKQMLRARVAPGRTFGAWVCLLAVMTLWAPMGAVALQANGMACCDGNMCMAHSHPKPKSSQKEQPKSSESPMNCENHGGRGILQCSMACDRETSPPVTTAMIFLLPNPSAICEPALTLAEPDSSVPRAFVPSYDPLSPPPRMSDVSL